MTSRGKQKQVDVALSDEAIDWLVVLSSGRATQEDHAAFDEWRQTSPAHELAAREAETIWHGLGIVGDEARHEEKGQASQDTAPGLPWCRWVGHAWYRRGTAGNVRGWWVR